MLVSLYIKNFILIEEISVDLSDRFNAFTGETGAGKSLFVDALNFVSGERSTQNVVGTHSDSAYVEAGFFTDNSNAISILEDMGFEIDPNEVTVFSREMNKNGRSISKINGRVVNQKSVREVLAYVLDIHSQHETQYLMNNSNHIYLLDSFINDDKNLLDYKDAFHAYKEKLEAIEVFKSTQFDAQEIEVAKEVLKELDAFKPSVEDYEITNQSLSEMENFEITKAVFNKIEDTLSKDTNVLNDLYDLIEPFESIEPLSERYRDLYYQLEDISYEISRMNDGFYFNEYEFENLNNRMDQYTQYIRKYGSVEALLDKQNKYQTMISNVDHYEDLLTDLNNEKEALYHELVKKANVLSNQRKKSARHLETLVVKELHDLMLENAVFKVDITSSPFTEMGQDRIVFMVSMNKGVAVSMLSKVASGGELSRLMLGLKVIFSDIQGISTLIFDEIDAGVSGRVAFRIGEKMKDIAKKAQVISITHLPAVAACADHHFLISKQEHNNVTKTHIAQIQNEARMEHLALMMTGNLNDKSIQAARDILEQGQAI